MASVSKQFTALSIRSSVTGSYNSRTASGPTFQNSPNYAAGITITQLLHHTSGLRDYLTLSGLAGNPPDQVITERGVLNTLARQIRLNFEPGADDTLCTAISIMPPSMTATVVRLAAPSLLRRGSGSSHRSACETPVSSMITLHRSPGAPSGTSDEARPGGSRTACLTSSVTAACTPLSMTCCGGPPLSSGLNSTTADTYAAARHAKKRKRNRQRLWDGVIAGDLSRRPYRLPQRLTRRLPHQLRAFARREADGRDVVQQLDGECCTAHADGGGALRACGHVGPGPRGGRHCCPATGLDPAAVPREFGQALAGVYYSAESSRQPIASLPGPMQ